MPKPPHIDEKYKINFIVNYFLQGCTPPFWLFVETAAPAAQRVVALLLLPDLEDIVQSILGPGSPRRQRPTRHGGKRKPRVGFPDTSELIGHRIRGVVNPIDALSVTPTKHLFKLLDKYEGVAFSAAILEGLTDTVFEGLLGVITMNPDDCPGFAYIQRHSINGPGILGLIGYWNPMSIGTLDAHYRFNVDDPHNTTTTTGPFTIVWVVECQAWNGDVKGLQICLQTTGGVMRGESQMIDLDDGQTQTLMCSGEFEAGEEAIWLGGCASGTVTTLRCDVFGFSGVFA